MVESLCQSSLASLASGMIQGNKTIHRTLKVELPTANALRVPNNEYGKARWVSPSRLRLVFNSESSEAWSISFERDLAVWEVGSVYMKSLSEALADPIAYFDVSFGGDPQLWFWGIV